MESLEREIKQLFSYLQEWRKLPKYQLERRLDIFFAIYLKEIIQGILKDEKGKPVEVLDCIIPEFPIQKSEFPIPEYNDSDKKPQKEKVPRHSFNIDYVMFTTDMNLLLIELKTDMRSKGELQKRRMLEVKKQLDKGKVRLNDLIKHIKDIQKGSKKKKKYKELLKILDKDKLKEHRAVKNGGEVVYIQPLEEDRDSETTVISFDQIADEFEKNSHQQTVLRDCFTKMLRLIVKNHS